VAGEFSEQTLDQLLQALHARTASHPENPGLVAFWPGVREERMAAACGELRRRGHPVFRVAIDGALPGVTKDGWAIGAVSDQPIRSP
jgi:hypothetical protein